MCEKHSSPVIVIGDACVDVTVSMASIMSGISDVYHSERLEPHLTGGGTSANTTVALSKLGVPTSFMGTIGADYGGRFILREFAQNNIGTEFTIVDDSNTIYVFAFIDPTGERTLWAFPREGCSYANLDLSRIDMERVKQAAWVHASGMTYMAEGNTRANLPAVFKAAYEAGIPTSFDLNTRAKQPEDLDPDIRRAVEDTLPYVKYLLGSAKDEFYSFRPCPDWHDSVRAFAGNGRSVISRMGAEGAFVVCGDGEFQVEAFDVPVHNTTGAGDAFNAGFIAGMLKGCTLKESVLWGNGVAGYKVMGNSSRDTPDEAQLLKFIQETPRKR